MLSQNMTDKIIDYIMSHGGDFAEVFAEHTRRNQLAMTGGNMSEALAGIESGVGIRIFSGDQCAYFYTEGRESFPSVKRKLEGRGTSQTGLGEAVCRSENI